MMRKMLIQTSSHWSMMDMSQKTYSVHDIRCINPYASQTPYQWFIMNEFQKIVHYGGHITNHYHKYLTTGSLWTHTKRTMVHCVTLDPNLLPLFHYGRVPSHTHTVHYVGDLNGNTHILPLGHYGRRVPNETYCSLYRLHKHHCKHY